MVKNWADSSDDDDSDYEDGADFPVPVAQGAAEPEPKAAEEVGKEEEEEVAAVEEEEAAQPPPPKKEFVLPEATIHGICG